METLQCTALDSAIGPLFLAASDKGLVALEFDARLPGQQSIRPNPRHLRNENNGFSFEPCPSAMSDYICQLEEYFAGKRREFTFPLDLRGTDFQIACWRALLAIPYGETRSLCGYRPRYRQSRRISCRRHGKQSQPDRDRRTLPSRHRFQRHAVRIRWWSRREAKTSGT